MFCLIVTVPVVNYEEEKHQWNRHLYCLQCFLGPLFGVTATKGKIIGQGIGLGVGEGVLYL